MEVLATNSVTLSNQKSDRHYTWCRALLCEICVPPRRLYALTIVLRT